MCFKKLFPLLIFIPGIILFFLVGCASGKNENQINNTKVNAVVTEGPGTGDWKISKPEEQGMNSKILLKSDGDIKKNYAAVMSLLVIRHGRLVYEKYYNGKTKNDNTIVYSVSKSVTSALTGIALREKYLTGLDQKLSYFFPEYFTKESDPRKKEITIRNMLTMTGGLESCDKDIMSWIQSKDWFEQAINKPMLNDPGQKFEYNTGLTHLLSGVIARAVNMSAKEFADKYLFGPMGITNYQWYTDPMGYNGGGHLLCLTPRDMAKFGYLYLMDGKYGGEQIIPKEWVKESTSIHSDPGDGRKYGYLWWLEDRKDSLHNKQYKIFSAIGMGGQFITVVPDLDMVAVITTNADSPDKKGDATGQIITDYVIPAVK